MPYCIISLKTGLPVEITCSTISIARIVPPACRMAVCNETLRIHPVAMLTFPRQVEVPLEIGSYAFSPGDLVVGCIYSLHQREELYPQPQVFRPERFLERQFSPYEFMPFGGGVRRCIGTALAQCEMKIVLGTILSKTEVSLTSDRPVQPARRGPTLGQKTPVEINLNHASL